MGFMGLEKTYNRVNREVMRMYDVGGKPLNGIKSVYVNILAFVRVKGCKSECIRIDSGIRQVCFMSPWLFNVYINTVMKEVKMGMERRGVRFQEEGREWRLPGLFYVDGLVLCSESEEDLRAMVGRFVEVCRRKGLKVNVGKIKVMVSGGEKGLEWEVYGIRLECVSEFKNLGYVLNA